MPAERRKGDGRRISVLGARENNLKDVSVAFPLGVLVCVTGVSGAGKSTLVNDILYPALARALHGSDRAVGAHDADRRASQQLDKVIDIDQSPIGRTPRSNPATYTKVFDSIRDFFAELPEARMHGYTPGRFSFNVKGGRCEACEGDGVKQVEMHFLPDVYVPCEVCHGRRFNDATLAVKYKGLSIADVLDLTVDEALELFENHPAIRRSLETLADVGLGYIALGQPSPTLSGGEAQRIKLVARAVASARPAARSTSSTSRRRACTSTTSGSCLRVLDRLVEAGNTVVVIEHNLDVIKTADWVIDLGPEGGDAGGRSSPRARPSRWRRSRRATRAASWLPCYRAAAPAAGPASTATPLAAAASGSGACRGPRPARRRGCRRRGGRGRARPGCRAPGGRSGR